MNLQNISRYMSLILRHKPEVIGVSLDKHGWAVVDDLINGIAKNNEGFNMAILKEIVETDNKQGQSGTFYSCRCRIRRERTSKVSLSWNWRKICFIHS